MQEEEEDKVEIQKRPRAQGELQPVFKPDVSAPVPTRLYGTGALSPAHP